MNKLILLMLGILLVIGLWANLPSIDAVDDISNKDVSLNMSKKRAAQSKTQALVLDGVSYEAPKWGKSLGFGQNGGHLRAVDKLTGDELWVLEVYEIIYDGYMEDDKLDRFITKISFAGQGRLRINSERCGVYLVDIATQKVSVEHPPPC